MNWVLCSEPSSFISDHAFISNCRSVSKAVGGKITDHTGTLSSRYILWISGDDDDDDNNKRTKQIPWF
jgi:hypothetical protein